MVLPFPIKNIMSKIFYVQAMFDETEGWCSSHIKGKGHSLVNSDPFGINP